MTPQQSPGTSSPSASSIFLPLGRRSSRASISTQAERESLNAALDQIHTEAYQSGCLTVFSDFAKPPAAISATDEKGFSGEIQGGLSGLYSRLRVSVGGVRDIMSGGKSSDKDTIEGTGNKSPALDRSAVADSQQSHPSSNQGSKLHSPVNGKFQPDLDGPDQPGIGKGTKPHSNAASVSSKTSTSPAPAMKSPVAPLTKAGGSSAVVDPAVTELNVRAVREPLHQGGDPANPPSSAFQSMDSSGAGREEHSLHPSLSQSSLSLGQRSSHSPGKTFSNPPEEELGASGISRSSTKHQGQDHSRKSSSMERHMLPEIDTSSSGTAYKSKQTDGGRDGTTSTEDRTRTNSTNSLNHNESAMPGSEVTSITRASNSGENSYYEGQTPSTLATSVSLPGGDSISAEGSKAAANNQWREKVPSPNTSRSQGHTMSQAPQSETTTKPTAVVPLNAALDRAASQELANRRPPVASDGVISQLRSKLLSKEFWMRDENAKDCFHCGEPFSTFRRKHHCRTCGQIFDSKCTLLIPGDRFGQPMSIRVCRPCEAMINAHEDDSSEFSDSEQSQIAVNPRVSELGFGNSSRASGDDDDTSSVVSQPAEHVMKTPTMAIPATRRVGGGHDRRSAVLEINPDRSLARPTSSRSLKSSLSGRTHSMGHKRHPSRQQYIRNFKPYIDERAPFQRRQAEDVGLESRLPAFHRDNIIDPDLAQYLSDDASSDDEQPSLMSAASENGFPKSAGDSERTTFGGFLAAMKKGRSPFGDRNAASSGREGDEGSISSSRAVNLPRATRRRNLSAASSIHQRPSPRALRDTVFNLHNHSNASPTFPLGVGSAGSKMTRSSSIRRAGAPPVELNKASLQHVRRLLQQLLKDTAVPHADNWETALLPILLKAADEVNPDVQRGDDMDILHYVKLKKILGGRPGDTSYVSGLVFTKNVALKSMPRSIPRPNILIITFPLEYARHQPHFMSLEPVIRQEREFLENLVSRIAALRPNLLLVEKNVSGLALELLEDANIATAFNVKSSVLEAVSRCTQTKIITSMDKLVTTPMTSQCGSFDVKTYVYNGRKKTYMYISGCPKELGCTIVLRGGDSAVLSSVKRITEFMIYVVYNLKLETYLMRDEFAQIPTSLEVRNVDDAPKSCSSSLMSRSSEPCANAPQGPDERKGGSSSADTEMPITGEVTEVPDDVPMPTYYENMVQDHETKILSASPFVKLEPPYLLMRAREMERRLAYLKRLRDQDLDSDQPADERSKFQKFVLITPEMVHASSHGAPPKVKEVLRAAHDAEYDRALHHYQTQKRQWEGYVSGGANLFDPYAHQNIAVLFSHVCTTTSIPCAGPDLFMLEYYNEHGGDAMFESDCTLGQYVEDLCHNGNAICAANGCEKRLFEHHRQYVHGEAQISVFVQPCPSKLPGLQDTILMWSCCKICGNETQVIPMSDSTWKYSFGKYLELSFYSKNLRARAGVCPHDLQRDHLRYFGFKDVALRIHYDSIKLLEIFVPRTRVTWKVDKDLRLRNEVYMRTEQRLNRFMASVKARLKGINVESVIPQRVEECKKDIDSLLKKASEDQTVLIRQLQEKYTDSRYWEVIPLNDVLRSAQEKVVEWDIIFAGFENSFFPSEKDIRRLATLQLKKIFLDRDASVTSLTSTEEASASATDAEDEISHVEEHQRPKRRMTLSPQKAQDVLVSVVEEHSGKKTKVRPQQNVEPPSSPSQSEEGNIGIPALSSDEKLVSHAPHPEAVAQEEASYPKVDILTNPHEQYPPQGAPESNKRVTETPARELDQQEKGKAGDNAPDSEAIVRSPPTHPPSAIPRPAEGGFRRSGRATSPSYRAQPQSPRLQNENMEIGKPAAGNVNRPSRIPSPPNDSRGKSSDKKISDRLMLSALKNGRLPGPSLIPRSVPKRDNNSRVSNLARHFEQLSREFEKERQRERRRRAAKGTPSRAYPVASSKPIVEVYKNVREAVEEPEPAGDSEETRTRILAEDSSRGSEEFAKMASEEEYRREHPQGQPAEPMETAENMRADNQVLSEGEVEEAHSDEERISTDELRVSHDELAKLSPEDESIDLKELPNHERNTLLKMLTNFWSERSASGWAPLDYPLTMSDHVFADCDIIVREDEPSSLIAFTLDSEDYKQRLEEVQQAHEKAKSDSEKDADAPGESRVEHALLRATGTHLKYQFQEGHAKMLCKVFYAEQFDALRKKCGVADRVAESLSRCMKWDSRGGKTKSLFLKTLDDRFILKSLSPIETQAFLKFAPAYFQIMSEALFHELPSAIAKMFGFYEVIVKNPATGTEFNWYLLLMENLFYDRVPTRIFDLKGSMRNRKVQSTGERNEVLLDENMVDFIYESPLFVREHSKKLLSQSVWNDTLFLGRQNVMDYSLMIAIDESRNELVVGIIDCIRTYTWDKKLESWIKDRGFTGGGKNRPTVTSPREYKSRFREAMARYVLQAPG